MFCAPTHSLIFLLIASFCQLLKCSILKPVQVLNVPSLIYLMVMLLFGGYSQLFGGYSQLFGACVK